jgi:hypothetical protein
MIPMPNVVTSLNAITRVIAAKRIAKRLISGWLGISWTAVRK